MTVVWVLTCSKLRRSMNLATGLCVIAESTLTSESQILRATKSLVKMAVFGQALGRVGGYGLKKITGSHFC